MDNRPFPLVAISACLLGQPVRYDGAHKRQPVIIEQLQPWLEWLPLCPEVAAGLGTPRPPVQLVQREEQVLALGVEDRQRDVTPALKDASEKLIQQLRNETRLSGVIVKSRSPSCGLGSTPIHNTQRQPTGLGSGLFAQELQTFPQPCVEESWLDSPERCRRFLLACLEYRQAPSGFTAVRRDAIFNRLSDEELEQQLAPHLRQGSHQG